MTSEREYGLAVIDDIIRDSVTGRERFNERWESFTDEFIESIKTAKVYIDCGAEYGFYLRLALKYGWEDLKIIAFEPEPIRCQLLKTVTAAHPNVTVYPFALSNVVASRELTKPAIAYSASFDMHATGEKFLVQTTTLDKIVRGADVDVIKMDIEGAEDLALLGGIQTIKNATTLFVEFHPDQSKTRLDTYRNLLSLGFYINDSDAAKMIHGGRVVLRRP